MLLFRILRKRLIRFSLSVLLVLVFCLYGRREIEATFALSTLQFVVWSCGMAFISSTLAVVLYDTLINPVMQKLDRLIARVVR